MGYISRTTEGLSQESQATHSQPSGRALAQGGNCHKATISQLRLDQYWQMHCLDMLGIHRSGYYWPILTTHNVYYVN